MSILTTPSSTATLSAKFVADADTVGSSLWLGIRNVDENERFEDCLGRWAARLLTSDDAEEVKIGQAIDNVVSDETTDYSEQFCIEVDNVMLSVYKNGGWWKLGAHHSAVQRAGEQQVLQAVTNLILNAPAK